MVDEPTVTLVRRYLQRLREHGLPVSFGVVFGSYARGEPGLWSDIDLMVISPRFDSRRSREDVDLLWRVAARTDSRIEPIPCGDRQWREDQGSPIVEIARREGQMVTA